MATASYSSELTHHHHHHHYRRDSASSNKSAGSRRPRLLRSYATEPSITTENACRGLLTSPTYSSRRATELLNRVAVSNSNSTSPTNTSSRNSVLESERLTETSHESRSYSLSTFTGIDYWNDANSNLEDSACYFSFPSFDTWEEERRQDEEKAERRP
ncbi:hypothetical protein GGR55DRAFT_678703 [Xylaria sp. FL0064]|nr:hypothetical protein GGR55DRAFT_678703 [Xylaria sp. FL0064]